MPLAPTGSLTAAQFCYPAELPLTVNKLKRFETGSEEFFLSPTFLIENINIENIKNKAHSNCTISININA